MKAKLLVLISCVVFGVPCTTPAIMNGGFEDGDPYYQGQLAFPNWIPGGNSSPSSPGMNFQRVHTLATGDGVNFYNPKEGQHFAALYARQAGSTGFPPSLNSTSLSQLLTLGAGDELSGWAAFRTGFGNNPNAQYEASVSIIDSMGLVQTVWHAMNTPGVNTSIPWQQWDWTAPSAGEYTLQLTARTLVNSSTTVDFGVGLFDAIVQTAAPPVPDAGSTLLLLTAALSVVAGGRRVLSRQ